MLAALEDVESLILRGRTSDAIKKLSTLRAASTAAAPLPPITDCAAQREIRELVDLLLANIGA